MGGLTAAAAAPMAGRHARQQQPAGHLVVVRSAMGTAGHHD
eukprot:SAG11_NODE_1741_length_4336_cov_1.517583_1_plen_41_part_00